MSKVLLCSFNVVDNLRALSRFFAAAELKTMFCHLLLNYDVKFDDKLPTEVWYYHNNIPDPNVRVSFRARVR